jgi:FkbM family methyltransferase
LRDKKVFLYGAGSFGKEMLKLLTSRGVRVEAFIDRNAARIISLFDLPVYTPDDPRLTETTKDGCLVLFSIVMDRSERRRALQHLRERGFRNIAEAQAIRCLLVHADDCDRQDPDRPYLTERKADILGAATLFVDDESMDTYRCNVKAHISRDYTGCVEYPMAEQYFPKDIALVKGFGRIIDCGAYTGDTLRAFADADGGIEAAISFEPDTENFKELRRRADTLSGKIDKIFLYPCAVSDRTGMTSFSSNGGSSMLNATGEGRVLSVALDDVLKGFAPTFIKMDIEGQEVAALKGARGLIAQSRPDLAISVYHCINHIWEVPLLLDGWHLGYKIYLRTYNACTMETILYATCAQ